MLKTLLIMALLSSFVMAFLGVVVAMHGNGLIGVLLSIAGVVCMLRTFHHINNQGI